MSQRSGDGNVLLAVCDILLRFESASVGLHLYIQVFRSLLRGDTLPVPEAVMAAQLI